MKHKKKACLLLLIFFSNYANAWTINANFEDGEVDQKAMLPSLDSFHKAANNSTYTNARKFNGNKSGKVTTAADGSGEFGRWGGAWNFESNLKQGDEIWFRVWVYYPNDFKFTSSTGEGMKFMRIHVASANGKNEGYHHNFISQGKNKGKFFVGGEVRDSDGKTIFDNKSKPELRGPDNSGIGQVSLGQWHAYEEYVLFHSTPGKAIRRTWFDGRLVMEDTQTATLGSSTSYSDFIYIWTYWNGGAPKVQSAFIDDVIITSDQPSKTDNNGYPFLGTGNVVILAAPKAPSFVVESK